jgi:nucleoside-diphosphate-sugar epimerase
MRLLITGCTGFTGRAVLKSAAGMRLDLRLLEHRARVPPYWRGRAEVVGGDLAESGSLDELCAGVDAVLHLASMIGGAPAEATAVNVDGTRRLMAAAADAGVRRIVHLSTAAVYGHGPHRGETESELTPAPVSPTSRTRLAAEQAVLAHDGIVLRPSLVFGEGDRWVIPTITGLLLTIPAWIGDGRAKLSMIEVSDLAGLLLTLATRPGPSTAAVYHANHPVPVTQRDLLTSVAIGLGLSPPDRGLAYDDYLERLRAAPSAPTDRQVSMLAFDHWYESARIWTLAGRSPGSHLPPRLTAAAAGFLSLA